MRFKNLRAPASSRKPHWPPATAWRSPNLAMLNVPWRQTRHNLPRQNHRRHQ